MKLLSHSADLADELLVVDLATSALVEVGNNFFSFILAAVIAEVDHAPSEVVGVNGSAGSFVHGGEASLHGVGAASGRSELFEVFKEFSNVEFLKVVN